MIGIDANVLVRYLTQDDPDQGKTATEFIENSCTKDINIPRTVEHLFESNFNFRIAMRAFESELTIGCFPPLKKWFSVITWLK